MSCIVFPGKTCGLLGIINEEAGPDDTSQLGDIEMKPPRPPPERSVFSRMTSHRPTEDPMLSYLENPTGRMVAEDITDIEPKPNLWRVAYYSLRFLANKVHCPVVMMSLAPPPLGY